MTTRNKFSYVHHRTSTHRKMKNQPSCPQLRQLNDNSDQISSFLKIGLSPAFESKTKHKYNETQMLQLGSQAHHRPTKDHDQVGSNPLPNILN